MNYDEAIYLRRALHVSEGLGPQDPSSRFDHGQETNSSYDHPHFGQLFLAGIFQITGYPSSLHPSPTIQSIEMLYMVPRVLMGILAVVDTFLIYKIVERRYNNIIIALIASILFAVMPLSWLNRWILLDNILLPFLLLSILFSLYLKRKDNGKAKDNGSNYDIHGNLHHYSKINNPVISISNNNNDFKKIILIILSGIFLGIAIYTKITAFTMIPLVGFFIFTNSRSFKFLGLWLVPVILIPSLWPLYALSVGQFDEWLDGVLWQGTERRVDGTESSPHSVLSEMISVTNMDPVLVITSIMGVAYAVLRRDYLILLWIVPFLIFAWSIHWIYYFHFILLLPVFCIASALLIWEVPKRIIKKENYQRLISIFIISAIGLFGLISVTSFISNDVLFVQLIHVSIAIKNTLDLQNNNDSITIISAPEYSWIFKYIFDQENAYQTREFPNTTEKVLLMVDRSYYYVVSKDPNKPELEDEIQIKKLLYIYNNTNTTISIMNDPITLNLRDFPFTNIKSCSNSNLQIRTNY